MTQPILPSDLSQRKGVKKYLLFAVMSANSEVGGGGKPLSANRAKQFVFNDYIKSAESAMTA